MREKHTSKTRQNKRVVDKPLTEVAVQRVEAAGLLHAVPDGLELVRKVGTSSLGRVKVALDGHADAASDNAITVATAQL